MQTQTEGEVWADNRATLEEPTGLHLHRLLPGDRMELPLDEIPEAKAEPKEQWQLACFHRSVSLASKAQKIPETEAQVLLNLVKAGAMEECASKVRIFMMEQEKKVKHADHFIT